MRCPTLPTNHTRLAAEIRGVWLGKTVQKDDYILWATATLCFCGFLRSGEVTIPTKTAFDWTTYLTYRDIAVDEAQAPKVLKLHLKA